MTPFYNTPEKLAALTAAALRWLGTPFRENSRVPGPRGGVSCHNLVAALYVETGALPPFDVPRGSARRLLHNPADTITAGFDRLFPRHFAALKNPTPADVLPGDMLVLREGNIGKHVAIALPGERPEHGPRLIHALLYSGCQISQLADASYAHALLELRRPLDAAQAAKPAAKVEAGVPTAWFDAAQAAKPAAKVEAGVPTAWFDAAPAAKPADGT